MTRVPDAALLADPGLRLVWAALPDARVVGGAVRDRLLGVPVADIDLATPQPPAAVMAALLAAGLGAKPTGIAHGTVTAVALGKGYQVTTLRRDVATDGRRAVVAFTDDWQADAARRDFTMNALSMDRSGRVFDYWEGLADLRAGRVRFVGDAVARIAEDYLRVLRFFRFYARFGRVAPDFATESALRAGANGVPGLSGERVRHELLGLLAVPDPRAAVALMDRLDVLAAVLPDGVSWPRFVRLLDVGAPADPLLRLAALASGDVASLAARLRLSVPERRLLAALRVPSEPADADPGALRRALAELDPLLPVSVLTDRAWLADDGAPGWAALRARLAALERPVFPLAGRDARRLGVPAGPELGRLLGAVRAWWLAGGCVADRAACLTRLAESSHAAR